MLGNEKPLRKQTGAFVKYRLKMQKSNPKVPHTEKWWYKDLQKNTEEYIMTLVQESIS